MKKSPCEKCDGRCCKYNHILLENNERLIYASITVNGHLVLPMNHGACPHLNSNNNCDIYDHRPKSCRTFECVYGYKKKKGRKILTVFLQDNPDIVDLIEREKLK